MWGYAYARACAGRKFVDGAGVKIRNFRRIFFLKQEGKKIKKADRKYYKTLRITAILCNVSNVRKRLKIAVSTQTH